MQTVTLKECITDYEGKANCNVPLSKFQRDIARKYKHYGFEKKPIVDECNAPRPKSASGTEKDKVAATLTAVQDFLQKYVTPAMPTHGVLLWHSTGAGKTCTAVSIASNFEAAGYVVVYVTMASLISEIAKNVWGSVICHAKNVEDYADNLSNVPMTWSNHPQWLKGPMSYKSFSNLIGAFSGKSDQYNQEFYSKFMQFNQEERRADPFYKTLIIIDEAQKLFSDELPKNERPNVALLQQMLLASYAKSKGDASYPSAKVVLMTATPISKDPFEMMKLMNLMREDQLPTTQAGFVKDGFMDDKNRVNVPKLMSAFEGYISFVDLSENRTKFASKVIHEVRVPMSSGPLATRKGKYNKKVDLSQTSALQECAARFLPKKPPEVKSGVQRAPDAIRPQENKAPSPPTRPKAPSPPTRPKPPSPPTRPKAPSPKKASPEAALNPPSAKPPSDPDCITPQERDALVQKLAVYSKKVEELKESFPRRSTPRSITAKLNKHAHRYPRSRKGVRGFFNWVKNAYRS